MNSNNNNNKKSKKRRVRKQALARQRNRNRKRKNRIPAAYSRSFKRMMKISSQNGTSMIITGRDLIYKIPDILTTNGDYALMTIIPANPAYWLGTRMAAIASGYQNFRPLKMNIYYIPQVAVTQQGNVLAGTLWSMAPNITNLQQTLKTSNGGILTQCYKPAKSTIELGKNLQFNLYRTGGKFDQESNPFIYVAVAIATTDQNGNRINPGYFYVDYKYELRNPIGDTIQYYTSGLIKNEDYVGNYVNETLINCANNDINPGAIIQKDDTTYTWNGKPVQIQPTNYVWFFCNTLKTEDEPSEEEDTPVDLKYSGVVNVQYAGSNPIIQIPAPTNGSFNGYVAVVYNGASVVYANKTTSTATVIIPDPEATYYSVFFSTLSDYNAFLTYTSFLTETSSYQVYFLKDGYTFNFIQA